MFCRIKFHFSRRQRSTCFDRPRPMKRVFPFGFMSYTRRQWVFHITASISTGMWGQESYTILPNDYLAVFGFSDQQAVIRLTPSQHSHTRVTRHDSYISPCTHLTINIIIPQKMTHMHAPLHMHVLVHIYTTVTLSRPAKISVKDSTGLWYTSVLLSWGIDTPKAHSTGRRCASGRNAAGWTVGWT